jgi:2'-5' RNA ligase
MYSIASVFGDDGEELWQELEDRCKLSRLRRTEIPHFSWQTAESYDFVPLREELENLSRNIRTFTFHTSGLGIFPSENRKILFLNIIKDRNLLDLHEMIWENTILYAQQPNAFYSPDKWIPHISLNLNSLENNQFTCAIEELTSRSLDFEFRVTKIGLLYLTLTSSGIDCLYDLNNPGQKR